MKLFICIISTISCITAFNSPFYRNHFLNYNQKINHPFSRNYYESYLKRLNSQNISIQQNEILGNTEEEYQRNFWGFLPTENVQYLNQTGENETTPNIRIIINKNMLKNLGISSNQENGDYEEEESDDPRIKKRKSKHIHVSTKNPNTFKDVGGYDSVKSELLQCIDMLKN
jgi:ATP-dependent Zn protease